MKSSNDIYTDGTYLVNNPTWGVEDASYKASIIANLLRKNNMSPNEITEVGCGSGGILSCLFNDWNNTIPYHGYDISPQAIALAKKSAATNIQFYNEDFTKKEICTDLLLMIDVLEHVDNYYSFLGDLKSKATYFVFHIPLDLSCRTILKPHVLLQQRESVGHIHYFSKEMVMWMLRDKGFTVVDWIYTKPTTDHIKADSWKRGIKKTLRNASFYLHKDLSAKCWGGYSMMILAK